MNEKEVTELTAVTYIIPMMDVLEQMVLRGRSTVDNLAAAIEREKMSLVSKKFLLRMGDALQRSSIINCP